jgi:hypothetical protein
MAFNGSEEISVLRDQAEEPESVSFTGKITIDAKWLSGNILRLLRILLWIRDCWE